MAEPAGPSMAGPWLGVEFDLEYLVKATWSPGDVLEADGYDYEGGQQGRIILVILGRGSRPFEYEAKIVGAEDSAYSWWAFESGEADEPMVFKLSTSKRDKGKLVNGKYVNPTMKWRVLGHGGGPRFR